MCVATFGEETKIGGKVRRPLTYRRATDDHGHGPWTMLATDRRSIVVSTTEYNHGHGYIIDVRALPVRTFAAVGTFALSDSGRVVVIV